MDNLLKIKLLFALILLGIGQCDFSAYGQSIQGEDIYLDALKLYVDTVKSHYKSLQQDRYDTLVIRKGSHIKSDFPKKVGDSDLIYLDDNEIEERFRKHGEKSFSYVLISPLYLENGAFIIDFTDYWINKWQGDLISELEGGVKVEYVFDCQKRVLVVSNVTFMGI